MKIDANPLGLSDLGCGAIIFILLYTRILFGIDFSDESQYIAEALQPIIWNGFFKHDLFVQQIIYFFYWPFVQIYTSILKVEGIFLFFRNLYFLQTIICSSLIYYFAKDFLNRRVAFYMGISLGAFIPFSIPSISYNTAVYSFFPLILTYVCFKKEKSVIEDVLCGLILSVTVYTYPPIIFPLAVLLLLTIRNSLRLMVFTAIFGLTFLMIFLNVFGVDLLKKALGFSSEFTDTNLLSKSFSILKKNQKQFFYLTFFGIFCEIFISKRGLKEQKKYLNISCLIIFLLCVVRFKIVHFGHSIITYAFLVLLITEIKNDECGERRNFYIVSLIGAIVCSFFSSNGLLNSSLCLIVSMVILMDEFNRRNLNGKFALQSILLLISFSNFFYVYRDEGLLKLTKKVRKGPLKGLHTSEAREQTIRLLDEISTSSDYRDKKILSLYLPTLYAYNFALPESNVFYIHDSKFNGQVLKKIFQDLQPQYIFIYDHLHDEAAEYAKSHFCKGGCLIDKRYTGFEVLKVN